MAASYGNRASENHELKTLKLLLYDQISFDKFHVSNVF